MSATSTTYSTLTILSRRASSRRTTPTSQKTSCSRSCSTHASARRSAGGGHENVKSLLIYWDEVSPDCKQACQEVDERWLDVPTAAGVRRKSMYGELRRVCPVRPKSSTPTNETERNLHG